MTSPLSPEREAEIRARAEAATPGPWAPDDVYGLVRPTQIDGFAHPCERAAAQQQTATDAEFIAHSRADVPDLLAEVDRLREELALADGTATALDHERAETKRLRDAIHDEAALLSRHAVAAEAAELHDEAELADATAFRLRAALAAPTTEETP